MASSVRTEIDGSVHTIVLSRPERRNAVDRETAEALHDAFRRFDHDEGALAAVLWGEGGNFCAGADLHAIAEGRGNRVGYAGAGPMGPTRMALGKPVIAAVSGYAVAGGLELALWCDLRVVERSAVFGVFCRRLGVPLIDGGTVRLPRLIGESRALDLVLTGRPVDAAEAFRIGLANRIVDDGRAREEAEALARRLAGFPPMCLRNDLRSVREGLSMDFEAALRHEARLGLETLESGEALEGARRFALDGAGRHGSSGVVAPEEGEAGPGHGDDG